MKKLLSILLTIILAFSCFSILGMTALAAENDGVLLELNISDITNWTGSRFTSQDTDGDGTKDAMRLDSTTGNPSLFTPTFILSPGKEYKISFDIRVPEGSYDYLTNTSKPIYPKFVVFQPGNTAAGETKANGYSEGQNDYAYKYEKYGTVRRPDFYANWQVGNYDTKKVEGIFGFGNNQFPSLLKDVSGNAVSSNVAFEEWTEISATFTAIDDETNGAVGDQVVSMYFTLYNAKQTGAMYDIRNIKVIDVAAQPEPPEEPEVPEIRGPEVFEDFEGFDADTKLFDCSLSGTQNMYVYSSKAVQATQHFNLIVTDEKSYEGTKSLMGKTYYQYAAMPLNLTPNTKYELSFWYTYSTNDADQYLREITYGVYSPVEGTSFSKSVIDGAGTRKKTETFEPDKSVPGEWIKGTVDFETGDNVDNIVFAYTYYDKLKSDSSQTVNKCPLYIDNISIMPVTEEEPENTSTDHGYVITNDDNSTAVPYDGNEFLGWYKEVSDTPYSTETTITTATINSENLTPKFLSHNLVNQNGYEDYEVGTDLLNDSWAQAGTQDSWVKLTVDNTYAKSGEKSLKIGARQQKDIYLNLSGLKENTDYVVSYSWMLPYSAITATDTMNDGYYGSAVGTTATTKISNCYAKGDYTGSIYQAYVGGQWNKVKYLFNTNDNTDLRLFLQYDSNQNTGNDSLYLDEFMVYEVQYETDNSGFSSYSINVNDENSYAYSSVVGTVEPDTEVTVTAAPYGGYEFDGWYEKGVKVSESQMYTFNANANRTLTAKSVAIVDSYTSITPDINKNGATNLEDVTTLAKHLAGWKNQDLNPVVLDVNGDGSQNLNDLVLLARYVANWDVKDQLAKVLTNNALPEEDLTDGSVRELLLAGQSEYFNKSTIVNKGNQALLAKVIKKAQNGEDITVVGIGGSITQGSGVSDTNRYGEHVSLWLKSKFPDINVTYVNAGIGSTTSLVGIHRLDTDVLAHNPDIVLVDFTVNDGSSDERYKLSYETIIRKLLKNNIAVISLVFGSTADPLNPKRAENAMKFHLPSMLYYNVPVIDYYGALWRYIDGGIASWNDDLTRDGLHPSDTGHIMIASAVEYYLNGIIDAVNSINTALPELPESYLFGDDVYETATFLASTEENNYTKIEPTESTNFTAGKVHGAKLGKGWICDSTEGGSITFEVKGVISISIFLQHKEGVNGKGDVIINGKTVVDNTDCSGGSANGYVWISYNEIFDTPQDLTITITSEAKFGVGPLGVTY